MNLVISGQSVTVTSGVKVIFHVMAGLKKKQRAHKAPPRETSNSKEFTKNHDFYEAKELSYF